MEKIIKVCSAAIVLLFASVNAFSSDRSESSNLVMAYNCYKSGNYSQASIYFRKAVSESSSNPESWYMLINSQMYEGEYVQSLRDAETFEEKFPDNSLLPYIQYQKGRAYCMLGRNDEAVLALSDFCHRNPSNEMYSNALFWMGECFYSDCNFETAKELYEQVVFNYPDSEKSKESAYKLDIISQMEREEKLLYLLKMTGEEYLEARSSYELKFRKTMAEAEKKIQMLEKENIELKNSLDSNNSKAGEK